MAAPSGITKELIDISGSGADNFVKLYYTAYDTARPTLSTFYRAQSAIVWNGNPLSGAVAFGQFIDQLPDTKHEVQSYDCHPIVDSPPNPHRPPSILLTVSGLVAHGQPAIDAFPSGTPAGYTKPHPELLPRVFSQTFVLQPEVGPVGETSYFVAGDTMRFVG